MYANNPKYTHKHDSGDAKFYIPTQTTELHTSRYVEMNNQRIFAASGVDKTMLEMIADEVIRLCNDDKAKTIRTDIGTLMQNIKYRLKSPVDELCGIRMGAALCFMELPGTVEPEAFSQSWQQDKMKRAMIDPDLYSFFLTWGIANIPEYKEHLDTLSDTDYFQKRMLALQKLKPSYLSLLG